jgi:hypothetical protein
LKKYFHTFEENLLKSSLILNFDGIKEEKYLCHFHNENKMINGITYYGKGDSQSCFNKVGHLLNANKARGVGPPNFLLILCDVTTV